jgi:hypothetical protein
MAQRLEAALRRPGASPAAADRAPPVAPDVPSNRTAPPPRPAANDPAPAAPPEGEKPADSPKTQFKNLEDEMASLLGRPKTPS